MGVCVGKSNVVERDRKPLSSPNNPEVENVQESSETVSSVKSTSEGTILDYFPNAKKKAFICGVVSEVQQKGFADKNTDPAFLGDGFGNLRIGCACKKGLKPESPNQDDFCIFQIDDTGIYGVFDGHGPFGHDISNFVQEKLPRCLVRDADFYHDPEKALTASFAETQRQCTESQSDCRFDCTLSGTTATIVLRRDGLLFVAHVGDSRAVLARTVGDELKSEDLTVDHKPTCDSERKRIQAKGGQVRRLEGDIPHRVFVSGKLYPGLAMTRSIGDTVGTTAGVTSMPEVKTMEVQKDWRFVLVCSDGIWEFIGSQEAVNIINRYPPHEVQKAADCLASEAWNRWIEEEGNIVDDITVIVAYFNET